MQLIQFTIKIQAEKKSLEGYKIEITTKENNLHIKDNTGGMSFEELEKAFTPYANHSKEQKIIGKYGIGLQRSLYKLGDEFSFTTCKNNSGLATGIMNRKIMEEIKFLFTQKTIFKMIALKLNFLHSKKN